jgi:ATP/maltotriose-dependent transcriptional regulator MalT
MSMAEPDDTQRQQLDSSIAAELDAEGLEGAEEIGRGGFGVVYRCVESALGRVVAVKVLSSDIDTDSRARFVREQRAMAQLSGHPNVVEVLHTGVTMSGRPYIVMPYHRRDSLRAHLQRSGPLEWQQAVTFGVKLAGALESAHRLGILHRDVKPGNVLVTEYGEPQLTDFGIARVTGAFETSSGEIFGSPAYTAPEVIGGDPPNVASDVYGLGATLFSLLTGHAAAQQRSDQDVIAQFLQVGSTPVPDLRKRFPGGLSDVVVRAMAISPSDRQHSAAEFGEQLRDVQRRHCHRITDMALLLDAADDASTAYSVVAATPPSAATKFRPPIAARALVKRAKLIDRLWSAGRKRLIVIHAPAGFGKSTLATQWREHLISNDVSVAWLSIDSDDNNVTWFLEHLVESIQQARPDLATELRQALEDHGPEAERYVLTSLINEIHDTGERFAVVIDDWHRVTDPGTIGAIEFLLENSSAHLQIVVTSRSQAGLPLSRLRVSDELVEIDSADLRFDVDETYRFLVDLGRLRLAEQQVVDLRESTDGWVAALQLASLSLRNQDDPAELISHLSGRHRAIAEYLAENVLSTLDPVLLDFMLGTSVTERICADLASTLTGVEHCQDLLEEVERRDLFLRALDDERQWFRYHHLFADFLRRRLERDRPGQIAELHRRAARWFSDHGMLSEAVDHAIEAGDHDRAADLVENDGLNLVEDSQMSTLLGLIAKLPTHLVAERPLLQIALGWAHVLLHHPPEPTQKSLDATKSMLSDKSPAAAEVADQILEASLVQAVGDLFADRVDGLLEPASQCLARPESLRPFVVSGASNVASFEALHRFDFPAARRWIEWATPYHERTKGPFSVMYGYCFAGIAAHEQLDVAAAETLFRTAEDQARRSGGSRSYAVRLAGVVRAELLYERGRTEQAEQVLDDSRQLGSEGGVVDFMLITYGTGARIKTARGDIDVAAQLLDEGARIAASLSLPRLAARIENERVRCGLAQALSMSTAPPHSAGRVDGIATITRELREDSEIRVLLRGSTDDVLSACAKAQVHLDGIDADTRPRAHLQAQLLFGASLHLSGRTSAAKDLVAPSAARCAHLGLPRVLLDGGPQMASLIESFVDDKSRDPAAWPQLPTSFLEEALNMPGIG